MSVFDFGSCIKITFDKPIIVDPEVIIGSEYYAPRPNDVSPVYADSSHYSSYGPWNAFDHDTGTTWLNNAARPVWIRKDFGANVFITKLRMYLNTNKPKAFQLQGSSDASSWADVYVGECSATTGWQEFTFTGATYRYWRVYVTTVQSNEAWIYEIEFFGTRNTYRTDGWEVSAQESAMSPEGIIAKRIYEVRKVSRSEDGLSIYLWLDLDGRILNPLSDITVKFSGSLIGPGYANVAPFELSFSPTELTRVFNPHDRENLTMLSVMSLSTFDVTYRYNKHTDEYLTASAAMTVLATNVGGLPL